MFAELLGALDITVSQFFLLFGLLLGNGAGLLLETRHGGEVPVAGNVPLGLALYLLGVIIDGLGLAVGIIVARVPLVTS